MKTCRKKYPLLTLALTLLALFISSPRVSGAVPYLTPSSLAWDDPNPVGTTHSYLVYQLTGPGAPSIRGTTTSPLWPIQLPAGTSTVTATVIGFDDAAPGLESTQAVPPLTIVVPSPVSVPRLNIIPSGASFLSWTDPNPAGSIATYWVVTMVSGKPVDVLAVVVEPRWAFDPSVATGRVYLSVVAVSKPVAPHTVGVGSEPSVSKLVSFPKAPDKLRLVPGAAP